MKKQQRVIGISMINGERTEFMSKSKARKMYKIRYEDLEKSLAYDCYQAKKYKWLYEDRYNDLIKNNMLQSTVEKAKDHFNNLYYKRQIICIDKHGCKFIYNSIKEASDDTLIPYNAVYNELQKDNKKSKHGYKFYYRHLYDHAMSKLKEAKQAYLELM